MTLFVDLIELPKIIVRSVLYDFSDGFGIVGENLVVVVVVIVIVRIRMSSSTCCTVVPLEHRP